MNAQEINNLTLEELQSQIDSVHPATCENPDFVTWELAMGLVGQRHAKYDLVNLVYWLLVESKEEKMLSFLKEVRGWGGFKDLDHLEKCDELIDKVQRHD